MNERDKHMIEAAKMLLPRGYLIVPMSPEPFRRWPFMESPGDFTERLERHVGGPGGALAGLRTVLIEEPPALSANYLASIAV